MSNLVAQPKLKDELLYEKGKTPNIIQALLDTVPGSEKQTKKLAKKFPPTYEGLEKLWHFVKNKIRYIEDPDGVQWIRTPARLWHDREGDCKSFTLFIVSILTNMGIDYKIRFVSFAPKSKTVTHVYPVAILDGDEVILDAVWSAFDDEANYEYKRDYTMTQISRLSGVDQVGNLKDWLKKTRDKIKKFWRNKTVNKIAIMCLYAFYPYKVKEGSRTAKKIAKAKKLMAFLIEQSPFNRIDSEAEIKKAIKEKTGKTPEEIFRAIMPPKVGRIGEPITIGLIITAVSVAYPIVKEIIEHKSDIDLKKEDAIPNLEEMQQDTIVVDESQASYRSDGGNAQTRDAGQNNSSPEKDDDNNQIITYALIAAAAYAVLS